MQLLKQTNEQVQRSEKKITGDKGKIRSEFFLLNWKVQSWTYWICSMLQSFHGPGIPDQNLWGLVSGHSTSLLQGLQLCVADRLSWTDLQALTAQLLLILTLHFAKGKKEPKLLKLDQKSNTHWDEMCWQMTSHNKPKIYIRKVQQTYIKGEFIIYYNNYKLLFSEHSRWSTTCISAVTKKVLKLQMLCLISVP